MAMSTPEEAAPLLVVSAHPGDFVWRAGGAIALAAATGERAVVACLSFGERGESAQLWASGADLAEVKRVRRDEAERAAAILGAEVRFYDAGDYPLIETPALLDALVALYRDVRPSVVLTHGPGDPYNGDHPAASAIALRARQMGQAPGVPGPGSVIGAPPVFFFEPHQPEVSGFRPDVLLDVSAVWERKRAAMEVYETQRHLWTYYTDLGRRRGVQLARNSGPNLGAVADGYAEAYQRLFPQVVRRLA
jgi:4-oxalomesaconate hydratase